MFSKGSDSYTTERLIAHYNERVSVFGPSHQATQWLSEETQYLRYAVILDQISTESRSIVDLGCGYGEFYHFLRSKECEYDYVGLDISAQMIIAAQKAYPGGRFLCLSMDEFLANNRADCFVASGFFNLKLENSYEFLLSTLRQLLSHVNHSVIINLLSHRVKKWSRSSEFVYWNPEQIKQALKKETTSIDIIEGYLANDVTLVLRP